MKLDFQLLIITFLGLALSACTYTDDSIYYVEPIPGDSATVHVITNLDSIEQSVIADSLLFKYSVEIAGGELYFNEASINNLVLYQYATNYDPDTVIGPFVLTDSFWIQGDLPLGTGMNTLLFSVYYSSNTNSLADRVRREANILNLEFYMMLEGGNK